MSDAEQCGARREGGERCGIQADVSEGVDVAIDRQDTVQEFNVGPETCICMVRIALKPFVVEVKQMAGKEGVEAEQRQVILEQSRQLAL